MNSLNLSACSGLRSMQRSLSCCEGVPRWTTNDLSFMQSALLPGDKAVRKMLENAVGAHGECTLSATSLHSALHCALGTGNVAAAAYIRWGKGSPGLALTQSQEIACAFAAMRSGSGTAVLHVMLACPGVTKRIARCRRLRFTAVTSLLQSDNVLGLAVLTHGCTAATARLAMEEAGCVAGDLRFAPLRSVRPALSVLVFKTKTFRKMCRAAGALRCLQCTKGAAAQAAAL